MIRSEQLRFAYAGRPTLAFPDLDLPQGGVLVLHGPSGCGKSTWLALAAALMPPTAGRLWVAGQPVQALSGRAADAWRARTIGFLPQRLHLSPSLTVQQNLAMAQWAAGVAPNGQAIAQALDALGVGDLGARLPGKLSGGQAQRVALARAVLLQPRVLLADEPTASLDDDAAAQALGSLLQARAARDASLVIATHDARVASGLAQRVAADALQLLRLSPADARPPLPGPGLEAARS